MAEFEPQRLQPEPAQPEGIRPPFDDDEWPGNQVPAPGRSDPPPPKYDPNLDRHQVYLIWIFQVAVLLASVGLCWKLGASASFWMSGVAVYLLICVLLGRRMWASSRTPDPLPRNSPLLWLMNAGVWITTGGFILFTWAIFLRTSVEPATSLVSGVLIGGFGLLLAWFTVRQSRYAIRKGQTPWIQFAIGVTIIPFAAAWVVSSVVVVSRPLLSPSPSSATPGQFAARAACADKPEWKTSDGKPFIIALGLSGGGYRAAAFHAGVLKALDEHCVPIRYLTTVSGGSIVGTYYALGHSPESFKNRIRSQRPGLPDAFLSIHAVALQLWWPGWNSADTYSAHFSQAFFGDKKLADTQLTPQLLVNATDIERGAREVFYKQRSTSLPELDEVRLADLVAASGAFPGAFQPKEVRWPYRGEAQPAHKRRFVDGGVVENLGYSGLAYFLHAHRTFPESQRPPAPDLFIVSDASAVAAIGELPPKVSVFDLLIRSQDVSYDIQLNLLRTILNVPEARPFDFDTIVIRSQYEQAKILLDGKWFTVPARGIKIAGESVAEEVASLQTLRELAPDSVDKAFWLGETLGGLHWPKIVECRTLRSQGRSCCEWDGTAGVCR